MWCHNLLPRKELKPLFCICFIQPGGWLMNVFPPCFLMKPAVSCLHAVIIPDDVRLALQRRRDWSCTCMKKAHMQLQRSSFWSHGNIFTVSISSEILHLLFKLLSSYVFIWQGQHSFKLYQLALSWSTSVVTGQDHNNIFDPCVSWLVL